VAAAVCWGVGEPLKVEEIQVEPPKFSEIRVKMLCASLCHTDTLHAKGSLIVSITTCLTSSYQLTLLSSLLI
jgi:Zn-dependent alcohol dehydrogenase